MVQQYSVVRGFIVSTTSLLLGASVVHNIYKPNLEIPELGDEGDEAATVTVEAGDDGVGVAGVGKT